jgi:hypothetical protein
MCFLSMECIVSLLYNHALGDHFFVTLMNCDLNVYRHIPYKPLQDCDYKQKKFIKQHFYARIKVPIVQIK